MVEDIGYVDENNIFHKNIVPPPNKQPVPPPNKQPVQRPQKKKISYDDLLTNMGIQLVNGKLELYNKNLLVQNNYPSNNTYKNANDLHYKMNRTNQNNIIQRQPFQQQQQQFQQQQFQQRPLSKEQYKQYLRFQYFKQQKEKEHINQIKSKKIQFTNPNAYSQIRSNSHSLKFFRFVGQK
jgi:hypothetical protein